MNIPVVRGVIDRRILVNFRVDPEVLARVLPRPFRPKLAYGAGMAGVCLIRLKSIRPRFLPSCVGISSENAAHRIAVEWDDGGRRREGVFIPRRDTSSRLNTLAGGRLFPGHYHGAHFRVRDSGGTINLAIRSDDGATSVRLVATEAQALPATSRFASLAEASAFFAAGSVGYSPSPAGNLDGLRLETETWQVTPLAVDLIESSYFSDPSLFPPGSVAFDCALLMRDIPHRWHREPGVSAQDAAVPTCGPAGCAA
jgi:uncharacterized protein YqjF (DUF2071 family)